jgi:hypothetical protein
MRQLNIKSEKAPAEADLCRTAGARAAISVNRLVLNAENLTFVRTRMGALSGFRGTKRLIQGIPMRKYLIAATLIVAFATPALADEIMSCSRCRPKNA